MFFVTGDSIELNSIKELNSNGLSILDEELRTKIHRTTGTLAHVAAEETSGGLAITHDFIVYQGQLGG